MWQLINRQGKKAVRDSKGSPGLFRTVPGVPESNPLAPLSPLRSAMVYIFNFMVTLVRCERCLTQLGFLLFLFEQQKRCYSLKYEGKEKACVRVEG